MSVIIDPDTGLQALLKRVGEDLTFEMDFSPNLGTDTIASITSVTATNRGNISGSTNVTVSGEATDNDKKINFKIDGGTHLEDYIIQAIVVSASNGDTLEGEGVLYVRDVEDLS